MPVDRQGTTTSTVALAEAVPCELGDGGPTCAHHARLRAGDHLVRAYPVVVATVACPLARQHAIVGRVVQAQGCALSGGVDEGSGRAEDDLGVLPLVALVATHRPNHLRPHLDLKASRRAAVHVIFELKAGVPRHGQRDGLQHGLVVLPPRRRSLNVHVPLAVGRAARPGARGGRSPGPPGPVKLVANRVVQHAAVSREALLEAALPNGRRRGRGRRGGRRRGCRRRCRRWLWRGGRRGGRRRCWRRAVHG
mmetsp:Transcript_12835/g.41012  ORF Transcript_12835/g.41012 Transcript_12835/m.41012 type:complete len:251 (-) Transcript_12835:401-1153(-)